MGNSSFTHKAKKDKGESRQTTAITSPPPPPPTTAEQTTSKEKKVEKKSAKANKEYNMNQNVIIKPTDKHTASLIFLHGLGDTGHGWAAAFKEIRKPHIKYILPTAPIRPVTLNGGMQMNAWFDIYGLGVDLKQDEAGLKESRKILLDIVEEEIKNGIPADRIIIGGFSQGGATAIYTSLTSGHKFAGVLALSTWLPMHERFPADLEKTPEKFKTPILQFHGDCDPLVPQQFSEASVGLLKSFGYTDVRYKVYRGLMHSSTEEEMDDINDFIVKATAAS